MRFVFGIGIGETRKREPIKPEVAKILLARVVKEATSRFGGCFVQHGEGSWINGNGDCVQEPSVTITVDVDRKTNPSIARSEADLLAAFARQTFDQEAVLVTELGSVTRQQTV